MSLGNHFRWYEVISATPGTYPRHPGDLISGWLAIVAIRGQPIVRGAATRAPLVVAGGRCIVAPIHHRKA